MEHEMGTGVLCGFIGGLRANINMRVNYQGTVKGGT